MSPTDNQQNKTLRVFPKPSVFWAALSGLEALDPPCTGNGFPPGPRIVDFAETAGFPGADFMLLVTKAVRNRASSANGYQKCV